MWQTKDHDILCLAIKRCWTSIIVLWNCHSYRDVSITRWGQRGVICFKSVIVSPLFFSLLRAQLLLPYQKKSLYLLVLVSLPSDKHYQKLWATFSASCKLASDFSHLLVHIQLTAPFFVGTKLTFAQADWTARCTQPPTGCVQMKSGCAYRNG